MDKEQRSFIYNTICYDTECSEDDCPFSKKNRKRFGIVNCDDFLYCSEEIFVKAVLSASDDFLYVHNDMKRLINEWIKIFSPTELL